MTLSLIAASLLSSSSNSNQDKVQYKSVKINNQVWMSENLSVSTFRNGDTIPQAKTAEEWEEAGWNTRAAWCYYNLDPDNEEKYGRLYNWYAINDPRGLAPKGWHIPGDEDWDALRKYLIVGVAGKALKSTYGWKQEGNGTNKSGFDGMPSGYRDFDGSFPEIGSAGYWWSSTDNGQKWISCCYLDFSDSFLHKHNMPKSAGLAVRCIKD